MGLATERVTDNVERRMTSGRVQLERRGHVLLDRPRSRGEAQRLRSPAVGRALCAAYGELDRDPELRVGVLHALGDHFTGGLDLVQWAPVFQSGTFPRPEGGLDPLGLVGPRLTKPIVAAVQGICFTIGIELLLATDIRVAARRRAVRSDRDQARHLPGRRRDDPVPARGRLGERDALAAHRRRVRRRPRRCASASSRSRRSRASSSAAPSRSRSASRAQAPLGVYATLASSRHALAARQKRPPRRACSPISSR